MGGDAHRRGPHPAPFQHRAELPASLARFAIDHVPGVHSLLRIPSSTIAYLNHPTYYLTANQADLDDTGVACPPVESYMPTLVEFMRRNPDISAAAMQ